MIKYFCDVCSKRIVDQEDICSFPLSVIETDRSKFSHKQICPKCLKRVQDIVDKHNRAMKKEVEQFCTEQGWGLNL